MRLPNYFIDKLSLNINIILFTIFMKHEYTLLGPFLDIFPINNNTFFIEFCFELLD